MPSSPLITDAPSIQYSVYTIQLCDPIPNFPIRSPTFLLAKSLHQYGGVCCTGAWRSVSTFGCQANYIYDFYVTNELKMLSLMGQFGLVWLGSVRFAFRLVFRLLEGFGLEMITWFETFSLGFHSHSILVLQVKPLIKISSSFLNSYIMFSGGSRIWLWFSPL